MSKTAKPGKKNKLLNNTKFKFFFGCRIFYKNEVVQASYKQGCQQGRIKWTRAPGKSRDREAP